MFGFVKKLLGKKADSAEPVVQETSSKPSATPSPSSRSGAPAPVPVSARATSSSSTSHATKGGAKKSAAPGAAGSAEGNDTVTVSLIGLVGLLPSELKPTRAVGDVASIQLHFSSRPLLEQLSHGCVRVPFGEVRKLAPEGFFTAGTEHDQKLVELPLKEILPQLQSGSYSRKMAQRSTQVPEEVTNLFSARTGGTTRNGASNTSVASKSQAAGAPPPAPTAPATPPPARPTPPPSGGTMLFTRPPGATDPAARARSASAKSAEPAKSSPIPGPIPPPSAKATGGAETKSSKPADGSASQPQEAPEPTPPVSKPISAPNLLASMKASAPSAASAPAPTPTSTSTRTAPPVPSGETTAVVLQFISTGWPEAIRHEIDTWGLARTNVQLPSHEIEAALKQGRVQYPWQKILSFLEGGAGEGKIPSSPQEMLDLPLQVIAPAFLAKRRPTSGTTAKSAIDQSIPDLFHGGKAAQAPAPAAPAAPAPSQPAPVPPPSGTLRSGNTGTFSKGNTGTFSKASTPTTQPAPAPAAAAAPSGPVQVMSIPLAMVDDSWVDALKSDIARTGIPGLKIELPVDEINRALKAGKIEYTWKQIRSWMAPPLGADIGADHAEKLLTLPLKVIAPMFLGQFKPGKAQKKLDCGSDIPDLFSGTPLSGSAAAAPAPQAAAAAGGPSKTPVEGLTPLVSDISGSGSTTQFVRKAPTDLGELFGQPGKRQWTPNDIVQNTARIRGVMGAVIAMQDGLLVAAHVPGSWKADATAAFLPQIYSRLSQYLKELNTGDLSSVTLNTAAGNLIIFNAGIIYFAVIGKPDEEIPPAPIKLIVNELSRHTK